MTAEQLDLMGGAQPIRQPGQLTERQTLVWNVVRAADGVTDDEAGAILHQAAGKHPADLRCHWCSRDGKSVLRSKALRPLVTRKRDGTWRPRNPKDAIARDGSYDPATSEIPF